MTQTEDTNSRSDVERIYDVCDSSYKSCHPQVEELTHTIAKDFHMALAREGIRVREYAPNGRGYLNTREYLLALSRLLDMVGNNFGIQLSMACLMEEPEPEAHFNPLDEKE